MSHPFFNTSLRRSGGQPRDLRARVDIEITERLEEAVDFVCLDAMVQRRRARQLPEPAADSTEDRDEFNGRVETFLDRLRRDVAPDAPPTIQRKVDEALERAGTERVRQLLAVQVVLAKELPDYWARFDAIRLAYAADAVDDGSGSERRGLLGRLFRR
jgi:hypothetical protein